MRSQTDDEEGPLSPGGEPPDVEAVRAVLPEFVGTFRQRPPAFSARKAGGVVAYEAARRGTALHLEPREVTIHALRLVDAAPGDGRLDVSLELETGAGTYVRSVARDLGERLGCGGYLHALRRTEAAGLVASEARTPDELEALAAEGRLDAALIPVERLLGLAQVTLDGDQAGRFRHGSDVAWPGAGRVQVHGPTGMLGIGELSDGRLHPRTVLVEGG
jgi:tRNA pseudouridine55 synthase